MASRICFRNPLASAVNLPVAPTAARPSRRLLALGLAFALAGLSGLSFVPATVAHAQRLATPYTPKHLYSETADPTADIAAALKQARREHKRVILDFGGDWCGDCQVLDIYFHQEPNLSLLSKYFVIVHVWIGREDHNLDVADKYGVPVTHGVPALAVLSPSGKVLYSQATGEFRDMRHMDSASVTDFLNRWKN
ncbi:MAG TPA: thioredoxin family protein [Granulicella sp.]|nr:thioredoxin family protein [Granulicella sp.]